MGHARASNEGAAVGVLPSGPPLHPMVTRSLPFAHTGTSSTHTQPRRVWTETYEMITLGAKNSKEGKWNRARSMQHWSPQGDLVEHTSV